MIQLGRTARVSDSDLKSDYLTFRLNRFFRNYLAGSALRSTVSRSGPAIKEGKIMVCLRVIGKWQFSLEYCPCCIDVAGKDLASILQYRFGICPIWSVPLTQWPCMLDSRQQNIQSLHVKFTRLTYWTNTSWLQFGGQLAKNWFIISGLVVQCWGFVCSTFEIHDYRPEWYYDITSLHFLRIINPLDLSSWHFRINKGSVLSIGLSYKFSFWTGC